MATYSTDLTTLNTTDSTGTYTEFASPYNGGGTPDHSGEQFIQGVDCVSQNTGKAVGLEISCVYDHGSGYSFGTDEVLYMWLFYFAGTNLETYANSGWRLGIGSSTSAWDWFRVGGSDYSTHKYGGWFNFAIDPTATETGTVGGGNGGTYRYFGNVPYTLNEVTKGDPVSIDAVRAGRGIISVTGSGGSLLELAQYNDYNAGSTPPGTSSTSVDSGRHRLGIFQQQSDKAFLLKGLLSFGTTSTSVTFSDSNKVINIDDCPHTYASFNKIEINNASSSVTLTNVAIFSGASTANGVGYFEMVANATVSLSGCGFNDMGTFTFLSNASLTGCSFNSCGQITHGGADFESCNFNGYEGTADTAYLLYAVNADPDGELDNCSFTKGTASTHAIEFDATNTPTTITLRGIDFSGYNASNGQTDSTLYFPSTSKSYTVNLIGCTGNISYKVGSGGSVTLVTDPVTVTFTGIPTGSELTIVSRGTAVDTGTDGSSTANSRDFVTTNSWTVDAYKGHLLEITSGADAGRYYVVSNTATTLKLDAELTATASSLAWSLYDENDDTEDYHVENTSGSVGWNYSSGAGNLVDVLIMNVNYVDYVIENFEKPSSSGSVPISMIPDANYYNP